MSRTKMIASWAGWGSLATATALLLLPQVHYWFAARGHRWLGISLLSFALSLVMVPVFRKLALSLDIVDEPNYRKVHSSATPLLGGAAVFCGFTVSVLANGVYSPPLIAILGGGTLMFIVGLLDDVMDLSASIKLLIQIVAVGALVYTGVVLRIMPASLGTVAFLVNALLTFLWVVGITNALNFFDGMDGLAGGLGAIIAFFLAIVASQTGHAVLGWIALAMLGSCAGFLPYNFRYKKNATIFLGDSGSTFMGFILAALAIHGEWSDSGPVLALAPPLLIFWVLIFDMVHITVERVATGKVSTVRQWLEYVGKDHLHHRLALVLGGKARSVLFIYMVSICLGISAVVLRNARIVDALLLIIQAAIIVVLLTVLERRGRILAMELEDEKGKENN